MIYDEPITLPRSVVEQVLNALWATDAREGTEAYERELEAIKALRAALEQPKVEQEPVAVIGDVWTLNWAGSESIDKIVKKHSLKIGDKLYAHMQPPRKPLTDEEIRKIGNSLSEEHRFHSRMFARAIERAVWEKFNG